MLMHNFGTYHPSNDCVFVAINCAIAWGMPCEEMLFITMRYADFWAFFVEWKRTILECALMWRTVLVHWGRWHLNRLWINGILINWPPASALF